MTALDARVGSRVVLTTLALAAGASLVLALSDEPTSGARDRLARLAALLPLLAFVAASLVRERMRRRGELRTLAASGIPEARGLLSLRLATAAAGAVGASCILAAGRADALLPTLPAPPFVVGPDGIAAPSLGLTLGAGGAVWGDASVAGLAAPSSIPLALGVALTGVALGEVGALAWSLFGRASCAAAMTLAGLVALHGGARAFVLTSAVALAMTTVARVVRVNRTPAGEGAARDVR